VAVDGPPDPRDLDGDFAHASSVEVRFADTDAMGHVNNAAYLTFVELARIGWWLATTGEPLEREAGRDDGLILAEATIAFRSPVFFGEIVAVETRPGRLGRTSLGVDHRLTASRPGGLARLVATCRSVLVRYDYATERPVPWPPELVERIEAFEGPLARA
jgi:acyl-CoA thioester hydrolase